MIHRLLVFFALAILPQISSAQKRVEVKDPEIKFSYLLPDRWQVKDDGYDYIIQSTDIKGASISITYLENAKGSDYLESLGKKPSFDEDFDFELRYVLADEHLNLKALEQGRTVIDDSPARWVKFQYGAQGDKTGIFYMYQKLDQTFKITSAAPTVDFEKFHLTNSSILESLRSEKVK
ncbi:hypothetical protein LZF95_12280 [Algoriphagus sp. AGSA1]|uniref:hypothetical protein n=1 Tax=Algoriphagus sp. AGSA1 TaxID=2907213 RepID=UPI001F2095D2|nr:hypothetical protein [Algoriphagus sp. AGSA1]MCE7055455.1 hypothetical protein [Algoriphagus sp. AGSA1]